MSEKIYAAITDDFMRRMRNWANAEAGRSMSAISAIYDGLLPGGGWGTDAPIILEGEAQDTASALYKLAIRYRQAVMRFWRYEGCSLREHARHVRVDLSYHTFEVWVIKGHEELLPILAANTAAYHDLRRANARSLIVAC